MSSSASVLFQQSRGVQMEETSARMTPRCVCDTTSVYWVTACRGVLHTPLPHPREFSSFCSSMQHADFVGFSGFLVCGWKE